MMFRYESAAFSNTAEMLASMCGELESCEEQIRNLSDRWKREPARPAPRERLQRELERLERRETSLNLMRRKLENIAQLYEEMEQRALDLAEEEAAGRSGESTEKRVGTGADEAGEDKGPIVEETDVSEPVFYGPGGVMQAVWRIIPPFIWSWPGYSPLLIPSGPGLYWPPRPPKPVLMWPPGRPVRPKAPHHRIPVAHAFTKDSRVRRERQERIHILFGTGE